MKCLLLICFSLTGVWGPAGFGSGSEAIAAGRKPNSTLQAGGTCATATLIPSLPFSDTGTLDATRDCGMGGMTRPYHDVFYYYTTTIAGDYVFDMCGSAGNTYLKVWLAGTCCAGATTAADTGCTFDDPSLTVTLTAGQTVYIQCGTYSSTETQLAYSFHAAAPRPLLPGERCDNAIPLIVPSIVSGSTSDYQDNLNFNCGPNSGSGGKDVVYSYTPDDDQILTFGLCQSSFNTKLYICKDNCTGTPVACNDDNSLCGTESNRSQIRCLRLIGDHTYYVVVDGFSSTDLGDYVLTADFCDDCQIRNYCEYPIVIGGVTHFEQTVNTCCASNPILSIRRQNCMMMANTSGPDVIFMLTLSDTSLLNITASGPNNNQLMVFSDCANPTGTCEGSEDIAGTGEAETISRLRLNPGTHYVSVSDNGEDACGEITLTIDSDHILPVELLGIPQINPGDGLVTMRWSTASELNNARFEWLRDGMVAGRLDGAETSPERHNYTWTDRGLVNGTTYHYVLRSVSDGGSTRELASADATPTSGSLETVTDYALYQNYPNPFNPSTSIGFNLAEASIVDFKVYNLFGQEVATILSGSMNQGRHVVNFDASKLASGVYLYRLNLCGYTSMKKMLLLK